MLRGLRILLLSVTALGAVQAFGDEVSPNTRSQADIGFTTIVDQSRDFGADTVNLRTGLNGIEYVLPRSMVYGKGMNPPYRLQFCVPQKNNMKLENEYCKKTVVTLSSGILNNYIRKIKGVNYGSASAVLQQEWINGAVNSGYHFIEPPADLNGYSSYKIGNGKTFVNEHFNLAKSFKLNCIDPGINWQGCTFVAVLDGDLNIIDIIIHPTDFGNLDNIYSYLNKFLDEHSLRDQ